VSFAIDSNVLIYASNSQDERHHRAVDVIERALQADEPMYLFWPVILGYVRVVTSLRLLGTPLSVAEALDNLERMLRAPNVRMGNENPHFLALLRAVSEPVPARGNLVHDAHIVALMRQHEVATVWTHDSDFRKFDGIRVIDPFAA